MTYLKLNWNIPGANELIRVTQLAQDMLCNGVSGATLKYIPMDSQRNGNTMPSLEIVEFVGNSTTSWKAYLTKTSSIQIATPLWGESTCDRWSRLIKNRDPSQYKDRLSQVWDSHVIKIRRSRDRLIFNKGITILVRRHRYIETATWLQKKCLMCVHLNKCIRTGVSRVIYTQIAQDMQDATYLLGKSLKCGWGRRWVWVLSSTKVSIYQIFIRVGMKLKFHQAH